MLLGRIIASLISRSVTARFGQIYSRGIADYVICCCTPDIETLGSPLRWGTPHAVMRGGESGPLGFFSGSDFLEHAAAAPPGFRSAVWSGINRPTSAVRIGRGEG